MTKELDEPLLLTLMFGEQAAVARATASARLMRWSNAFEDWVDERRNHYPAPAWQLSVNTWREFLELVRKAPWEVGAEDVQRYTEHLWEKGRQAVTVGKRIADLTSFYEWCGKQGADPECGPDFNPAKEVKRPKVVKYSKAEYLSAAEVRALLGVIEEDGSILGKRDYAFFVTRLLMGVPLNHILPLKWGQIQVEGDRAWIQRKGAKRRRLPEPAWKAMREYLEAAGRLEGMQAEDYIFAPVADPMHWEAKGVPEEWEAKRAVQVRSMNRSLRRYGRLAGIPDGKLNIHALRHTAAMLRLEGGDKDEEIQEFLDRASLVGTQQYLNQLAKRGGDSAIEQGGKPEIERERFPERKAHRRQPGEGMKHGMYAMKQPTEEVKAILAEGIVGLEEEIAGMRVLMGRLMETIRENRTDQEETALWEAYGQAAMRLSGLMKAEKQLAEQRKDKGVEEWLQLFRNMAKEEGEEFDETSLFESDLPEVAGLREGIAGLRLVMRRTLARAFEEESAREQIRLINIYGSEGRKLAKLLRAEMTMVPDAAERIREVFNQALDEVQEELGIKVQKDEEGE